jgi:hypothetical protein
VINRIGPIYIQRLEQAGIADLHSVADLQPDVVKVILDSRLSLAYSARLRYSSA